MLKILNKRLEEKDARNGFILDGFPRTLNQAKILESTNQIDKVLYLNVSDDECVRRLGNRKTCKGCNAIYGNENPPKQKGICDACGSSLYIREDDKEETIRKRLNLYHEETEPIIKFYEQRVAEVKINGIKQLDEVFQEICKALDI